MCRQGWCACVTILLGGLLAFAVSAGVAGCGEDASKTEPAKQTEFMVKQQKEMADFYKTSPPSKAAKKK